MHVEINVANPIDLEGLAKENNKHLFVEEDSVMNKLWFNVIEGGVVVLYYSWIDAEASIHTTEASFEIFK